MSKSVIVTELRLRDALRQWMIDELDTSFDDRATYEAERIADRLFEAVARGVFPGLQIAGQASVSAPQPRIELFDAALVLDAGGGP